METKIEDCPINCCASDHSENKISMLPDPRLNSEMQKWMMDFSDDLKHKSIKIPQDRNLALELQEGFSVETIKQMSKISTDISDSDFWKE